MTKHKPTLLDVIESGEDAITEYLNDRSNRKFAQDVIELAASRVGRTLSEVPSECVWTYGNNWHSFSATACGNRVYNASDKYLFCPFFPPLI